jgi:hypothetical protein
MLGLMVLTSYEILSEHDLFKPQSEIRNIGIMSLLVLEFLESCSDFDCTWGCEVVRLCDEAGIDLHKEIRKQAPVSEQSLKDMREVYREKKAASDFGNDEYDGNGYIAFKKKKNWKPEDDIGGDDGAKTIPYTDEKMWYRWDWTQEASSSIIPGLLLLTIGGNAVQDIQEEPPRRQSLRFDEDEQSGKEGT